MNSATSSSFPLVERARSSRVIETGNALIVAPTSTGKSTIGREILRRAVRNREPGLHIYLVPYPALAEGVYHALQRELAAEQLTARLAIVTGRYSDPPSPKAADVLVCTYDRFAPLIRDPNITIGRLVIDECHLLADETRGPRLEELIVRLKSGTPPRSLCALSAVVPNPESLAQWLGVPLLKGGASDRTVKVDIGYKAADRIDRILQEDLKQVLAKGEQAIIFYDSKPSAQKYSRQLKSTIGRYLSPENKRVLGQLKTTIVEDEEDMRDLTECLPQGIVTQHTSLSRETRCALEKAFTDRHVKVATSTPPMAGTVNFPAGAVYVRDVFRTEFVRGEPHRIRLSTGELLNLLGHGGYPGHAGPGVGIAYVDRGDLSKEEHRRFRSAISEGRGDPVVSRLPDSFDALMRLLLAVTADRGVVTLEILGGALKNSFWYHQHPAKISFDRPLKADILEDISAIAKIPRTMVLSDHWMVPDGVAGVVKAGKQRHNTVLRIGGMGCSCTKGAQMDGNSVCTHVACTIRHLLFDVSVSDEARSRAIYAAADLFRRTLDLGTKIREAVALLRMWRMIDFVHGGFRATRVGVIAANTNLDLLLVRTVGDRMLTLNTPPKMEHALSWLIEDYFPEGEMKEKWYAALEAWIKGVDIRDIILPDKKPGTFHEGLEQLSRVSLLCGDIAESLEKREVAGVYRALSVCIRYGVAPELAHLASAGIPELARTECRYLYSQHGIHNLEELSQADPAHLTSPRLPLILTRQWVEKAKELVEIPFP